MSHIKLTCILIALSCSGLCAVGQADNTSCGFELSPQEIKQVQLHQDFILEGNSRFLCAYAGTSILSKADMLDQINSWNERHDTPPSIQIMHASDVDQSDVDQSICVIVLWSKRSVQAPNFRKRVGKTVRDYCSSLNDH